MQLRLLLSLSCLLALLHALPAHRVQEALTPSVNSPNTAPRPPDFDQLLIQQRIAFLSDGGDEPDTDTASPLVPQPNESITTPSPLMRDSEPRIADTGLAGEYFPTSSLAPGILGSCKRTDANINFVWPVDQSACGSIDPSLMTARWRGQISSETNGTYTLQVYTNGGVRLWIQDHLMVDHWWLRESSSARADALPQPQYVPTLLNQTFLAGVNYDFKLEFLSGDASSISTALNGQSHSKTPRSSRASDDSVVLELYWQSDSMSQPEIIPNSAFLPTISDSQATRQALRDRLEQGWGTHYFFNFMAHVKLPESFALDMGLYQLSSNTTLYPISVFRQFSPAIVRPGPRTYDASFTEFNITWNNLTLVVQSATTPANRRRTGAEALKGRGRVRARGTDSSLDSDDTNLDIVVLLTASFDDPSEAGDYSVLVWPKMLWNGTGSVFINMSSSNTDNSPSVLTWIMRSLSLANGPAVTGPTVITAFPPGFDAINTYFTDNVTIDSYWRIQENYVAIPLTSAPSGISTGSPRSIGEIQSIIQAARRETIASMNKYSHVSYDTLPSTKRATTENGSEQSDEDDDESAEDGAADTWAPLGTASDLYEAMHTVIAWNTIYDPREGIVTPVSRSWDFGAGYVLFDWDNYFCSVMAGFEHKDLAYSNIIQVTKSKTQQGFIPNYVSGIIASRDRTEPYVGAAMVLRLYQKYQDTWLVDLLFQDLMDWNDWVWRARRQPPLDLIVLGTDPNLPIQSDQVDAMQGAKWESGLDNSPIYDDPVQFDNVSHHMLLYDIGMNSYFLSECQALAELAKVVGDETARQTVQTRYDTVAKLMQLFLWDDDQGIFVNRRSDTGDIVPHLAPTSFFPMLSGTATVAQAETMITRHLTNSNEFCLNVKCAGYPVPSISRSDATYHDQDYWRGRVWGPHNFLIYLGLTHPAYQQSQIVADARKTLVLQAGNLLLQEWLAHRHVHENFNGDTGEGDDVGSSDPFYHWGALNGYIGLLELGLAK